MTQGKARAVAQSASRPEPQERKSLQTVQAARLASTTPLRPDSQERKSLQRLASTTPLRPDSKERKSQQTAQAAGLVSTAAKQPVVHGGAGGASWAPEKSGYASSETDFSDASPLRSRASVVLSEGRGGEARDPSALSGAKTGSAIVADIGVASVVAAAAEARPPEIEKAGWTTSSSVSDVDVSESGGDRVGLNTAASTEVIGELG